MNPILRIYRGLFMLLPACIPATLGMVLILGAFFTPLILAFEVSNWYFLLLLVAPPVVYLGILLMKFANWILQEMEDRGFEL